MTHRLATTSCPRSAALATGVHLSTYLATLARAHGAGARTRAVGCDLGAQLDAPGVGHRSTHQRVHALHRARLGVALGTRVAQILFGIAPHVSAQPLPGWSDWLGVLIAPLEFTVLMRARPVDAPAILGVCVLASLGGRTMRIARGRRSARNARAWSRRTRRSQVVACQQSGCQAHVMHSILLQIPMGAPLPSRQEAGSGSATEGY